MGSILIIPAVGQPYQPPPGFRFADAQKAVGGYVVVVPPSRHDTSGETTILVNEEGHGLPFNPAASLLVGRDLVGTVIVLNGKAARKQVLGD